MSAVARLGWEPAALGGAFPLLLRRAGLAPGTFPLPPGPLGDDAAPAAVERWLAAWLDPLGLEAELADCPYGDVDEMLAGCAPALLRVRTDAGERYLAVVAGGRRAVRVLGPAGTVERLPLGALRAAVRGPLEGPVAEGVEQVLERAGVHPRRRGRARAALLAERLGARRVGGCWLLRPRPGAGVRALARGERLGGLLARLLAAHAAQYLLWIAGWALIGAGALSGRIDPGWLAAWVLVLATSVPLRALSVRYQGALAARGGALLKRRLLDGALRLHPDEVRHQGAGQLLGRVIESESMERLALGGAIGAALGGVELGAAFLVLAAGAGGWMHALLLAAWVGVVALLAWRYHGVRRRWTGARLEMTHDLVERMVGYRTRLAQEEPRRWHDEEEAQLERYLELSAGMDGAATRLAALAGRGWLLVGLAGLAPAFVAGGGAPAGIALAIGGVLLAWQSLARVAPALTQLPDAAIAWGRVRELFRASARTEAPGVWEGDEEAEDDPAGEAGRPLLEASGLEFRHGGRGAPVIEGVEVTIRRGDRVLLEGPSGGGKSTLLALLAGLREPGAGSLLLHGQDPWTVGAARWRRRVAVAPQFHENHLLTDTLAFNLLMGRGWPAAPDDLAEAEALCRELGLGEVLDRMPSGLLQMVGEGGWQLSHGERSRVFLARALLQGADLVVLDESFAALDAESVERAVRVAVERAPALLVVAHP